MEANHVKAAIGDNAWAGIVSAYVGCVFWPNRTQTQCCMHSREQLSISVIADALTDSTGRASLLHVSKQNQHKEEPCTSRVRNSAPAIASMLRPV